MNVNLTLTLTLALKVKIMYAVQNNTEFKFNSVIYTSYFRRDAGGVYKRPITGKRGPLMI